jgi:hypothetical protein
LKTVEMARLRQSGRALAVIIAAVCLFGAEPRAATPGVPLDGRLQFTIVRDGEPIGTHDFRFVENADGTTVDIRTDIDYRFLFLPLYRFRHASKEVWTEGKLTRLSSRTDDNGEDIRIEAHARGERLSVKGIEGEFSAGPGVLPSSLWNVDVVRAKELLSTVRGELLKSRSEFVGEEILRLNGRQVPTMRYRLTGQFARDVWYDRDSRVLVRVEFQARDGSWVEYVRK